MSLKPPSGLISEMVKHRRTVERSDVSKLFSRRGLNGSRLDYRKRQNKEPCQQCGGTKWVYRWLLPYEDSDRWFCPCGFAEVPE